MLNEYLGLERGFIREGCLIERGLKREYTVATVTFCVLSNKFSSLN